MSETTKPRVIAVLGMHRSGTSAVARALGILGAELGDDLLDSIGDQNPTGFFEDRWFLGFSDRVLAVLGMRWDSVRLIDDAEWNAPAMAELKIEACDGVRKRFGNLRTWAVKNPRTARLLPFWAEIFERCGLDPSYVLVTRHPLSVARSLAVRNGFHPAKSHLLWLLHVTDSVLNTTGCLRASIDYDDLLESPEDALRRLGEDLALPRDSASEEALASYTREFLSSNLRHSSFAPDELPIDPAVSDLSLRAYELLREWSQGRIGERDPRLQRGFRRIADQVRSVAPWLRELSRLDLEIARLERERRRAQGYTDRLEAKANKKKV